MKLKPGNLMLGQRQGFAGFGETALMEGMQAAFRWINVFAGQHTSCV